MAPLKEWSVGFIDRALDSALDTCKICNFCFQILVVLSAVLAET